MGRLISRRRDMQIDLIKIVCMLYIIGFRHLLNYSEEYSPCHSLSYEVTISALGAFMFYAGWFFQDVKMDSKTDTLFFYKKRFIRFYILYAISLLTLYIGGVILQKPWFDSLTQFILSFIGLSAIYLPNVGTLWFMSILMFFYIVTPIILCRQRNRHKWMTAGSLFLCLFGVYVILPNIIDFRLPLYFLFYIIGLLMSHNYWNSFIQEKTMIGIIMGFAIFITFALVNTDCLIASLLLKTIYISAFVVGLTSVCSIICRHAPKWLGGAVSLLSYIMLTAYLFHRQIFQVLKFLANNVVHIDLSLNVLFFVFLPICFVISFLIQSVYDRIIGRFALQR